jgi:hypothetical protein
MYIKVIPHIESKFGLYQAGFGLRQILKNMKEFTNSIHLIFIDCKRSCDRNDTEQIYLDTNKLNIPEKWSRLVKMINSYMQSLIKIKSKLSAPFIINKCVQRGDVLICLIFNTVLEYIIIKLSTQTRGNIFYTMVQTMVYADDIVIIVKSLA